MGYGPLTIYKGANSLLLNCKPLLSGASDPNGTKEPIKEAVDCPKDMSIEEADESRKWVLCGELVPEAVEEVPGGGVRCD